jgi:hypothetical protein
MSLEIGGAMDSSESLLVFRTLDACDLFCESRNENRPMRRMTFSGRIDAYPLSVTHSRCACTGADLVDEGVSAQAKRLGDDRRATRFSKAHSDACVG